MGPGTSESLGSYGLKPSRGRDQQLPAAVDAMDEGRSVELFATGVHRDEVTIGKQADGRPAIETLRSVARLGEGQPGFSGWKIRGLSCLQATDDTLENESDIQGEGRMRSQQNGGGNPDSKGWIEAMTSPLHCDFAVVDSIIDGYGWLGSHCCRIFIADDDLMPACIPAPPPGSIAGSADHQVDANAITAYGSAGTRVLSWVRIGMSTILGLMATTRFPIDRLTSVQKDIRLRSRNAAATIG